MVSTESTGNSRNPSLAVDSSGNIHVAWHDYTDYGGAGTDADIFYKGYEAGSGWTVTEVVSIESTSTAVSPSLVADTDGNMHITWHDATNYEGAGTDYDIFYKWSGSNKYQVLLNMATVVEGFYEIKELMESKGFTFDLTASNVSLVEGGLNRIAFNGSVLSWWSSNMDSTGRMAFIVAAMMDDGNSMVFGAITNFIPPEVLPAPGSYIIVNAMPYMIVQWFYYDTLNNRIATWSYWWYDSHSHPNWFWKIYWKWRNYINEYYGWHTYLPWWWWFWHYTYDKHWHNWSAEFPY